MTINSEYRTCDLPDLNTPVEAVARQDPVSLYEGETVSEALNRLRITTIGERIIYFYVTDKDGTLVGVVPTRRLLLSHSSNFVRQVMIHPVYSVSGTDTLEIAINIIVKRRLLALPVIDAGKRLIGVLDVSMFTQTLADLERRETSEETFQIVGLQAEQERSKSLCRLLCRRFPWLLCNIGSGFAAAALANTFDRVLKTVVAVTFFVPLILTVAESIAMQSVTINVQGIHITNRRVDDKDGRLMRELRTGTLLGIFAGSIVGVLSFGWLGMLDLALVVGAAIILGGGTGAALGHLVPSLVHRWKLDPKIASGPAVLALTDVAAVGCYFFLASIILL